MADTPQIYAIVVTYNGMQWYDKCFGSLLHSSISVQVIVIDNASSDDSVRYIQEHYPTIDVIVSDKNLGFAKANNIAIRKAIDLGADYVFLLNQDAWVECDTIGNLLECYKQHSNLGIVSPLHLNGTADKFDWKFVEYMPTEFTSDLYFNRFQPLYSVDFINAAAWLMSTECIKKVGGFDTSLFTHYGEDSNYCQRVLFHRFTIGVNTHCTICHDREFRKNIEYEYRKQVFQDPQLWRKIEMANINREIDVDKEIRKNEISICKSRLKLRWERARLHQKEVAFLQQVKKSRELNIEGGLVWL